MNLWYVNHNGRRYNCIHYKKDIASSWLADIISEHEDVDISESIDIVKKNIKILIDADRVVFVTDPRDKIKKVP